MLLRQHLLHSVLRLLVELLRAIPDDVTKDGEVFAADAGIQISGSILVSLALVTLIDHRQALALASLLFFAVLASA